MWVIALPSFCVLLGILGGWFGPIRLRRDATIDPDAMRPDLMRPETMRPEDTSAGVLPARWTLRDAWIGFLLYFLASLVAGAVLGSAGLDLAEPGAIFAGLLVAAVPPVAYLLSFARRVRRRSYRSLGWLPLAPRNVLSVVCILLFAFVPLLESSIVWQLSVKAAFGDFFDSQVPINSFALAAENRDIVGLLLIGVSAMVVAPLWEEFFFRGVLYEALLRWVGVIGAGLLSAALFGVLHAGAAIGPVTCVGLLLAWIYHSTGNLWCCVVFHALFNGVNLMLLLLP